MHSAIERYAGIICLTFAGRGAGLVLDEAHVAPGPIVTAAGKASKGTIVFSPQGPAQVLMAFSVSCEGGLTETVVLLKRMIAVPPSELLCYGCKALSASLLALSRYEPGEAPSFAYAASDLRSVGGVLALPVGRMEPEVRRALGEGVDFLVYVPA